MIDTLRAEALKLTKRPAMWIIAAVWIVLSLVFGYAFPYLNFRGAATGPGAAAGLGQRVLAEALPASLVPAALQGFPLFAGALALVVGALVTGGEYGWDTVKILFTSGPRRASVLGGVLLALGLFMLTLMLATFAADAAAILLVAALTGSPADWPPVRDVLAGVGAGWLIVGTWCAAGALLGVLTRGTALAVGAGLVWVLAVENVLRIFGVIVEAVDTVQRYLPGTSAGALAAALGVPVQGTPGGTPGVTATVGGTAAALALVAYLVLFMVGMVMLVERRDVA